MLRAARYALNAEALPTSGRAAVTFWEKRCVAGGMMSWR
jgi:hypothetical protein